MWRVYCDGILLYHSKLDNLQILNPSIELEENKTGSFVFTVSASHPYYQAINKMKSIVTVYQDDYLFFRGRVLDEETGWYNEKQVTCEGELAFLLDSVLRPYDYSGTVAGYLNLLIDNHNDQVEESKWFTVGNVTVTDNNDYIVRSNIDHTDTWTELQDKLVKLMGGYVTVRHDGYINYIDYLQDSTTLSPQAITFGTNLLDLKRIRKGADIATAVIPLGAKIKDEAGNDTDSRLTVASVNDGNDMLIDVDAQAQFGTIVKTVVFDDVTEAANLFTKGKAHLAQLAKQVETVELTAADLAAAGAAFSSFHLGTQVRVTSKPHGIGQLFRVSKLSVNLFDPAMNKLSLNGAFLGLGGALAGVGQAQREIIKSVEKAEKRASEAVYNVEQNMLASMQVTAENIQSIVAENYYLKDDANALISSVSTEIQHTKDSVEIEFTTFQADIDAVAAGADAAFEEIRKYIRFVDGKILLGEIGNELELHIANDRISFMQDGAEVAYFSNRKLYVTDAQILHSLQLGNFAWFPRANGNLSFKKI